MGENPTTTALYGRQQEDAGPRANESLVWLLAERVRSLLDGEPETRIDNPLLDTLTREVFGAAVGHARDAYDAAEAGMNAHIGELAIELREGRGAIDRLLALTERMPRQSRRDERQVEFQQFSTPPA